MDLLAGGCHHHVGAPDSKEEMGSGSRCFLARSTDSADCRTYRRSGHGCNREIGLLSIEYCRRWRITKTPKGFHTGTRDPSEVTLSPPIAFDTLYCAEGPVLAFSTVAYGESFRTSQVASHEKRYTGPWPYRKMARPWMGIGDRISGDFEEGVRFGHSPADNNSTIECCWLGVAPQQDIGHR
jgi:hypothetical protein